MASWHHSKQDTFFGMRTILELDFPEIKDKNIVIFGEWAGENIQRNVGVCNFKKFFYIFGVKVISGNDENSNYWLKDYQILEHIGSRIFDKRNFDTFEIDIDFNNPIDVQNELINLTNMVEESCPVTIRLMELDGIESVDNKIGEGIVWEYINDSGEITQCKVKGKKHSSSKVKKLADVDVEKLDSIKSVVEYVCTENRLEQMANLHLPSINNKPDFDRQYLGKFIKSIMTDIVKEEMDTISEANLTIKEISKDVSYNAKFWFFNQE